LCLKQTISLKIFEIGPIKTTKPTNVSNYYSYEKIRVHVLRKLWKVNKINNTEHAGLFVYKRCTGAKSVVGLLLKGVLVRRHKAYM